MRREAKLQAMARPMQNSGVEPMKPKDPFDEVLDAFAEDAKGEDEYPEDLDALYSTALAEGLLSEANAKAAFERLLDRRVTKDETGSLALVPLERPTVGSQIRACREKRNQTADQFAREFQLSIDQLALLESSTEPYDTTRLVHLLSLLAISTGIPAIRLNMILQSVRATLELKSTQGPELVAARKNPLK